jgi:AcrR family transcriptional regulator
MARTIGSHGPRTMEAIRKAGLRLIFEHGYAAMSLRQLAAEVGIQSGSLYNHISTKQELLFELVRDHINELLRQLDRALEGKQRPTDRLRAFTAFHVTYHMTRKREVFIANSELRSLEPKNYGAIVALRGAYEQRLAEILSEGLTAWYRPGGRLTREAIVAAHEKLVLSGVTPGTGSSRARAKRKPSPAGTARSKPARR